MTLFRCLAALIGFITILSFSQAKSVEADRVRIENRRQQLQA